MVCTTNACAGNGFNCVVLSDGTVHELALSSQAKNLNTTPLIAEVGALSPAILQGVVTASTAMGGAAVDVRLAALQSVSFGSTMTAMRQLNIPLQTIPSTLTSPAIPSTGLVSISSNANCPAGSPANANCSPYTLVVPASNPNVGVFTSSGVAYTAPAAGDVLFTVDAIAVQPLSGGILDCIPPEQTTSKDINSQLLKVTPGATTSVARIDYSGCT